MNDPKKTYSFEDVISATKIEQRFGKVIESVSIEFTYKDDFGKSWKVEANGTREEIK